LLTAATLGGSWLRKGVPYLSEADYAYALSRMTAEPEPRERRERVVLTNESDKAS